MDKGAAARDAECPSLPDVRPRTNFAQLRAGVLSREAEMSSLRLDAYTILGFGVMAVTQGHAALATLIALG